MPRQDSSAIFARLPLFKKELGWFERMGIFAAMVLNTSSVGSQILKPQIGFELLNPMVAQNRLQESP